MSQGSGKKVDDAKPEKAGEEQESTGRWKPGQSGNPQGRPQGSGEIAKLRASIAEHVPAIIAKQVELAKAGDAQAARILLERVLPAVKPTEQTATLFLNAEGTLSEQGRAILTAVGAGELAPGQGSQLLTGLSALAKLIETDELAKRVAALEKQHAPKA